MGDTMPNIDFNQKIICKRLYPHDKDRVMKDEDSIIRFFESDRGRIINSAAIRRLQQKTQVFPLERNSSVRSRLTHSLEVQQVGRYISKEIIFYLKQKNQIDALGLQKLRVPFESLVEMACLMHDIGNPPFGHFGESAIKNWFKEKTDPYKGDNPLLRLRENEKELNLLRQKIHQDLSQFEGNAQAIRLVHTLLKLNLSYPQIACILKYSKPAYWSVDIPKNFDYLMKKCGFYLSEEPFVIELRNALNMERFARFPLSYIMEAADDISYCIADLEDAVEKNIFNIDQLFHYLKEMAGAFVKNEIFDTVIHNAFKEAKESWRNEEAEFFMCLRVQTMKVLVPYAVERFVNNLPEIFAGTFNQALLEDIGPCSTLLKLFKKVAQKYVFTHPEVEQIELQGYRIIIGLLNIYHPLLMMPFDSFSQLVFDNHHAEYAIETRLFHKLPDKHRLAYQEAVKKLKDVSIEEKKIYEYYYRARLIQDYISGMTDLYAYDEYRRLMTSG